MSTKMFIYYWIFIIETNLKDTIIASFADKIDVLNK